MDLGRGLSYMQRDPNWIVKTVIGSLISLVPILNFAVFGYMLDVIQNVYEGRETPLPEWGENFGDRFVRGLLYFVIQFIYLLPMFLMLCLMLGLGTGVSAAAGDDGGAGGLVFLCMFPIVFIVGIGLGLLSMVAQARYAITNNFGEALRFGEIMAMVRGGLGRWLMAILASIGVGIVFGLAGMITCGLALIFFSFYMYLVQAYYIAQAYRETTTAGEPIQYGT